MVAVSHHRVASSEADLVDASPSGRLRVLHVVSHFPPDRVGGVGSVVAHVHRGLLARGHDSHVLTSGRTHDDPRVRRVSPQPGAGFTRATASHASWARGFDVVHFHHGEALPLLLRLRGRGVRSVLTLHMDNRSLARATRPRRVGGERVGSWRTALVKGLVLGTSKVALDIVARGVADRCTFISRCGARELTGSRDGGAVIHNGIAAPPTANPPTDRPPVLLYAGTAGPSKRWELLPALMSRVRTRVPAARMVVAGFDPRRHPRFVEAVARFGLADAFDFVGAVDGDDLDALYRSATALVVPSCYEGLPMVALEAMSHGLPVVATRAGGIDEAVIDGVTGRLVQVDDLDGLAAAAAEMLLDPAAALAMGEAGRHRVIEQFDVDRQVDAYLAVYQGLVRA